MRRADVTAAIWRPFFLGAVLSAGALGGSRLDAQTAGLPSPMSGDCALNAAGVAVCTKTNGAAFAPSATTDTTSAGNITTGTMAPARLPAATTTAKGAVTYPANGGVVTSDLSSNPLQLPRIDSVQIFGDSFGQGWGATDQTYSLDGLLTKDTPAPVRNYAVAGTTASQVSVSVKNRFIPSGTLRTVSLYLSGHNDGTGDTCGGGAGTNCVANYKLNVNAGLAMLTIPYANRMLASAATSTTGTWGTYGSPAAPLFAAPGSYQTASTAGATKTFTFTTTTATTRVGVQWLLGFGSTGTFTVSVDGTLVNEPCTGASPTFTSAPCGGIALPGTTIGVARAEYTVSPATTHTIIITAVVNAAIDSVDWIVPNSAANNVVYNFGPNALYAFASVYDAATAAVQASLLADGLPAYAVSQINGTPGVNTTTDMSTTATATCPASSIANHPNNCGHEHLMQTLDTAETAGFRFSARDAGGQGISRGGWVNGPLIVRNSTMGGVITFGPLLNNFGRENQPVGGMMTNTSPASGGGTVMRAYTFLTPNADTGLPYAGQPMNASVMSGATDWTGSCYNPNGTAGTVANTTCPQGFRNSTGESFQKGVAGFLEGTALASAATITPVTQIVHVTGTAAIATITVPPPMTGTLTPGGCINLIADAAWSTVTTGNIANAITATAATPYQACYSGSTAKWYLK